MHYFHTTPRKQVLFCLLKTVMNPKKLSPFIIENSSIMRREILSDRSWIQANAFDSFFVSFPGGKIKQSVDGASANQGCRFSGCRCN
jgi:hypothetical protein